MAWQFGLPEAVVTAANGYINGTISVPPSGAAGGVLSGTYPNPGFAASPTFVTPTLGVASGTSLALGAGTAGAPAYTFTGQTDLGFFKRTGNIVDFASGGQAQISFGTNGGLNLASVGTLAFSSTTDPDAGSDLFLRRDGAGILAQRNGVTAQAFRIYNTFTDSSNGEWAGINWTDTANVLTIGTKANGTGTTRNMQFVIGGVNKLDYGVTTAGNWTFSTTVNSGGNFSVSQNSTFSWNNGSAITSTASGVFQLQNNGNILNATVTVGASNLLTVNGPLGSLSTVVASLPSAATVGSGVRAFVTDATATTFMTTVAGGGANKVPVVSDGTNWKIG